MNETGNKRLFWGCFIALIATAFGFIVRAMIMDDWQKQFGLSETQKGQLFGVGLWPFAISIVLFSLIIDRIGYGVAMVFAFICHTASMVITMCAPMMLAGEGATQEQVAAGQKSGYWMLYLGNFIVALGNGTVEAVINPVVATIFARQKTKWLNILHAGWPGGLVVGGIIALSMGATPWTYKVGLLAIPVVLYAVMLIGCKFPVSERVAAGVSYRDMLKEVGFLGAFVVVALIVAEVTNVLTQLEFIFKNREYWETVVYSMNIPGLGVKTITNESSVYWGIVGAISLAFGLYTMSLGRIMFFLLLCIMVPLATTELGTDSWISDLMTPAMEKMGLKGGYVLVYTSLIMMVLRFFAGPIVHAISPVGLLAVSSAIAAVGLFGLSYASGYAVLAVATLYGFGKTFFWPTMLGVVAERFPKGGALTLNITGGVGMLGVGVVGAALLGNIQDKEIDKKLKTDHVAVHSQVMDDTKNSVFGQYQPVNKDKLEKQDKSVQEIVKNVGNEAKKTALKTVAIFPIIMLVFYLLLFAYFKSTGGYKQADIH
ncbi:MAG: MFS transporter [Zavarzinella sp.]